MSQTSSNAPVLTTENVESFIRSMMTALVHSTKSSNSIPAGSDYEYYSNFEQFRRGMGNLSSDLVEQIRQICQVVQRSSSDDSSTPLIDFTDAALYDLVVDMIDILLESADSKMNQMSGGGEKLASSIRDSLRVDQDKFTVEKCKVMDKPQLQFFDEIDNFRRRPFCPRLKKKPHSDVDLDLNELAVERDADDDLTVVGPSTYYPHPYTREILGLCSRSQYQGQIAEAAFVSPEMPSAGQPFEMVATLEALERMAEELDGVKELAVDLEHHHVRSFQGLTCLLQMSSRDKDYIVDVLALRQHMSLLLPLFDDPDVVKVFHGCEKDILWLQRDLGLYVVNCFDTYQAAKVLRYPALSLAHLLKFYCGVTLNKKYQLADWRERKLPTHLIEYAKLDTHYLLYVYDCLRRDVHATHGSSGIEAVLEASRRTCLQRYEKPLFYPLGYLKLVTPQSCRDGQGVELTFEQNAALSCLWNWRDLRARRDDESCGYIMSNAELLRIGLAVPTDAQDIVATGPLGTYVREHLEEIAAVLRDQVHGGGAGGTAGGGGVNMLGGAVAVDEEEFSLNLSSSSRASKKRTSFEIGMGGSRHQMGRLQGYSTVIDFTPCLLPMPAVSSFHVATTKSGGDLESVHRNLQHALDTDPDWKKKLYDEAKWRPSPPPNSTSSGARIKVEGSSALALGGTSSARPSSQMTSRLEKSNSEIKQFSYLQENKKSLSAMEAATDSQVKTKTKAKSTVSSKASEDIELLDTLPQSLTDIYNISNRNKWNNKDKKRNRDSSEAAVSASILDAAVSSQSSDWHHVDKVSEDTMADSVDHTLDLAASIGWMDSDVSSRDEMKKIHFSNESNNNSVGFQQEASAMSGTDSVSSSFDSKKSVKAPKAQASSKDKTSSKDASYGGYDYSRVISTGGGAMGAMSTVNTGLSGDDRGVNNPFLSSAFMSGGGNGGYSNAANRSNNNNNVPKARKQPAGGGKSKHNPVVVERRDTNRSQIFSASTNK